MTKFDSSSEEALSPKWNAKLRQAIQTLQERYKLPKNLCGASEDELAKLEHKIGIELPSAVRAALLEFGGSISGGLWEDLFCPAEIAEFHEVLSSEASIGSLNGNLAYLAIGVDSSFGKDILCCLEPPLPDPPVVRMGYEIRSGKCEIEPFTDTYTECLRRMAYF